MDRSGTLWLLALCETRSAGPKITQDVYQYFGKIKSYAKNHGIEQPTDPEIKQGYQNLVNRTIVDSDGHRGPIFRDDKSGSEIVRFTTLGKDLRKTIEGNEGIKREVQEEIGVEFDEPPSPWWPESPDGEPTDQDGTKVTLQTTTEHPPDSTNEYEIEATAIFGCQKCGDEVSHSYTVEYWFEESCFAPKHYSRSVTATCDNCGQTYEHMAVDPYHPITAI